MSDGWDIVAEYADTVSSMVTTENELRAEITQLRGNLSLAEEGLANYAQENERLRTALVGAYSLWSRDQGDGCETANNMADIINAALESLHEPTLCAIEEFQNEIQRLQRALYFWLPSMPSSALPQDVYERLDRDIALLAGYDGPMEDTAEERGWITLRHSPQSDDAATR